MQQPKKVGFRTLGCKLNFSETSAIARQFEEGGFVRTTGKDADIYVINTCSVTEHADKKCRNLIRRLHRESPDAMIAVTGCYAQLKPNDIAAIEGVSLVVSNNDKERVYKEIVSMAKGADAKIISCETADITTFFASFSTGDRTRSFLKVQDGCDYKCSYCTIHYARGASRNIPIADIVSEAQQIAATGQKEIVITGINTGDFGKTTGEKFIDLLRALDGVEGIERYRISSIEPNLLTEEVIKFCASSAKFQHHFHIPLQSGSDRILRRMGRRYDTALFRERIELLRSYMPDVFIGIDVIVGFPSESDEDFANTYTLLESLAPAYLHVFPFSERPGTPAASFPDKVRDDVKTIRAGKLGELCDKLFVDFYNANIGKTAEVLFESNRKDGFMFGYTGNYIRVKAPYDRAAVNKILRVRLTGTDDKGDMNAELTE